jgi:hypothetical protein|tara:strand:+ start:1184 stop:1606 length:423 start_codon:yes stop_codon:yes gene_type:complete
MGIHDLIGGYGEYFHSIRLHDNILLLDLKLPTKWEVKSLLSSFGSTTQIKVNDTTDRVTLISFYCPFDGKETETLVSDVDNIIKWNKDREEKDNLLNIKIIELEKVFESNNIESLRTINFDFRQEQNKLKLDGEEPKVAN